ncbi:NAD-dependent epimerase/dehydratase family protein [Dyella amyloliquefaciens]|uniref:NAD-dependent epimerase/dehydratase family protein n=1 Tax=Dyella amyloliquefaciens TaxID=1770545 RepID=UPI00102EC0C6|nr:NAD-dependent epimerase/dehydratase family protein [Dyella amyloliquefaciens]
MSARVLIAGCGDVGLRVAHRLLARGDEVWALRRRGTLDGSGIHWLQGDLTQPATLRALPERIEQLVYLPAPDARDGQVYRALFVDGLRHLLDVLDPGMLQRVLLVSSSAIYGEHGEAWVDEETPADPPGFNGEVLLEAERWLAAQPVASVVLRLAGLYGPDRLQLIERLRAGGVRVPRQHVHWANRIHVDDAAGAIAHLLAMKDPMPLYLGVDNTPLPLDVLYDHLAALAGVPLPAEGAAPAGVGSKRLSNARLRASGFVPQWPDARQGYAALLRDERLG